MNRALILSLLPLLVAFQDPEPPPKPGPGRTTTIDRAIDELARRLTRAGGRISVCWLLDASPSMADDRQAVAKKIDSVFADLPRNAVLQMAVVAFDDKPRKLLDLSPDRAEVRAAIEKAGSKGSGTENVFAAVEAAARLLHGEGTTRAIVLVTDESGNDASRLESTLSKVRDEGVHVHVLGRESRFGWPHSYEHDGRYWIPVLAGFDSAGQEVQHRNPLCCWQESSPGCLKRLADPGVEIASFQRDDPLACDLGPGIVVTGGYGPWGLERLAAETGGSFTILAEKPTYDPKAMEGYEPEWCSAETWRERNQRDPMRRALMRMFEERVKARDQNLRATFGKGEAKGLATRADRALADVDRWIAMLEKARRDAGEPTPGRDGKLVKRWYANVDLAIAQLKALAHYLEQYRLLLVDLATGRLEVGPHPLFLHRGELRDGTRRDAAIAACRQVDQAHPGTPWAWTARWVAIRLGGFSVAEAKPTTGNAPNPGPTPPPPPPPGEK